MEEFSPREKLFVALLQIFWHIFIPMVEDIPVQWQSLYEDLIAIGQAERLFKGANREDLELFFKKLEPVARFYREMGGIQGYQKKVLELLKNPESSWKEGSHYTSPSFLHIEKWTEEVAQAVDWGIDALAEMAEMIPLGGAADRLHLVDETTGLELPAARLPFAGRPLLHTLMRDLEAREQLYYQKYGRTVVTPVAIMTSEEKDNHRHVISICEEAGWFGRPKEMFRFFTQPLVPTVDEQGNWILLGPLKPLWKPGGHGAIWKLAKDAGIFDWFVACGRKKALVRQINNPVAGLDYGLLAFTGYGWKKGMRFGFASCPCLPNAAEGINVLVQTPKQNGTEVVLTNIEYCDFAKCGIRDTSVFSSNTNLLFVDLPSICEAVEKSPFPGLLINAKKTAFTDFSGEQKQVLMARLESTMQNIADVFVEVKPLGVQLQPEKTYITYNQRKKTISTAKRAYISGGAVLETPEKCFYDLLLAHRELLEKHCGFSLPSSQSLEEYLERGPEFIFLFRPTLGPLFSEIGKKLQGGRIGEKGVLLLELSDLLFRGVDVEGTLRVEAQKKEGSCVLENVRVNNRGFEWQPPFWKMGMQSLESVEIILKGKSRFVARNLEFKGTHRFVVEDGQEMELFEKEGELQRVVRSTL